MPTKYINPFTATILIALVAVGVFWTGLANPFLGDDMGQIVANPTVQSPSNIPAFFQGSTFYAGSGHPNLEGNYYRPLMLVAYSIIYAGFGPQPVAFHIVQLALHIASAILLFLVLRYVFRPVTTLALSLIFLVHPVNSQAVFAIASLQEPLFLVFGMLSLWLLLRFQTRSSWFLVPVIVCLVLAMFTKESGILFVLVALAYTAITDKKRFLILLSLAAVATLAYIAANLGALGSVHNPHLAPIDELSLGQRLLNIPAIVWYYLTAFTFPLHLAHGYYWADAHIDWRHVLAPLFGLTATILVLVWGGRKLYRSHARRFFVLYCWFGFWLVVGLGIHLQLVPLDLTVSETWFYFPMIGLLGMLACLYEAFAPRRLHKWAAVGLIALLCIGGVRTAVRGLDWSDQAVLAYRDVRISPDDFNSENVIADDLMRQGKLAEARLHAQRSIDIYPRYSNYNTLGTILYRQRDYAGAVKAYKTGLTYQDSYALYANLAQIVASFGEPDDGRAFIAAAIKKFPQDGRLWFYLAVRDQNNGDNTAARSEIVQANRYGMRNADITAKIMQNQPLDNN